MYTVQQILLTGGVSFRRYRGSPVNSVYLTRGNQLVATFADLGQFRRQIGDYSGWDRHHIVERDDLSRLSVSTLAPAYADQPCVLLPRAAHRRINSILRRENPTKWLASAAELRAAYLEAYEIVGDYCGGGERLIMNELMRIVDATFQILGIPR